MINIFKRKKKAKENIFEPGANINSPLELTGKEYEAMVSLVYASDMINTIYPACAACYGISEDKNNTYEERIKYIGRRVKSRHTSILEHSNIITQIFITEKDNNISSSVTNYNKYIKPELSDLIYSINNIFTTIEEITDVCRYLTKVTDSFIDNNGNTIIRITLGGTIRGYRYIFENIENRQNAIFVALFNILKLVVPSDLFLDFINDGVMEEYTTIEIDKDLCKNIKLQNTESFKHYHSDDMIDIINMDSLNHIANLTKLPKEKCFDFVSITTNFKNMSRSITHQLVRHRNGITQESQRYVDYSKASFNSPVKFKPDKYSEKAIYDTPIGDLNMSELGNLITSVYKYLINQGVEKEDARGFLPMNIKCGKLYMTFTLRTLLAFLHLRLDSHAQAEIRMYAEHLADITKNYSEDLHIEDMYSASEYYSNPIYIRLATATYENIYEEV